MENQSAPEPSHDPSSKAEDQVNRRRHPRYPCEGHAEVCLPHGGLLLRGRILNLSISGCFVECPVLNLERGTSVEIFFSTRQLQFRVAGYIAVIHPRRGAGIAFREMGPRRSREIANLVEELKHLAEAQHAQAVPTSA